MGQSKTKEKNAPLVQVKTKTGSKIAITVSVAVMMMAAFSLAAGLIVLISKTTKTAPLVVDSSLLKTQLSQEFSATEFLIKFKSGTTENEKKNVLDTVVSEKVTVQVDKKGKVVNQLTGTKNVVSSTAAQTKEVKDNSVVEKKLVFAKAISIENFRTKYPDKTERIEKSEVSVNLEDLKRWEYIKLAKQTNILEVIKKLQTDQKVESVEPNFYYRLSDTPNDYYYNTDLQSPPVYSFGNDFPDQYGPKLMNAGQAWDIEQGDSSVVLAVVDTGIDLHHADLQDQIWVNQGEIPDNDIDDDYNGYVDDVRGWDFGDGDNDPSDSYGHGTHIAGIIAAQTNNIQGMAGLCRDCKIMPVKVDGEYGMGGMGGVFIANALVYAVDNGADVINASWGGPKMEAIEDALDYAASRGVVQVFAAGNEGSDAQYVAPRSEDMIVVAASDPDDHLATWSNYGFWIDVAAPGVNILSTRAAGLDMYGNGTHIVRTDYYYASGTSFSAPQVVGLAGLILARHPEFTPEEVRQVIRHSARDIAGAGWDVNAGYGRINAQAALAIDNPCVAKISSPGNYQIMGVAGSSAVNITGTADCDSFSRYILDYGKGDAPSVWTQIVSSNTPVASGNLKTGFNLTGLAPDNYTLRLRVWADGAVFEDRHKVQKGYPRVSGFPIESNEDTSQSPLLSDINGDGRDEILVGSSIFNGSGSTLAGWPYESNSDFYAAADIFPEFPGKELIMTSLGGNNTRLMHLFKNTGEEIILGQWPKTIPRYSNSIGRPTIADVNNDGSPEIIFYNMILDSSGGELSGWPVDASGRSMVGNINETPELEIVIGSRIFNYLGEVLGTLPLPLVGGNEGSVAIGDIDNDGKDEIIAASESDRTGVGRVTAYNSNLTVVPGWPREITLTDASASWPPIIFPTLGDLNNDNWLEVVVATGDTLFLFNHDGIAALGWPRHIGGGYLYTNPLLADIDSDAMKEIIVGNWWGSIDCYEIDGGGCAGFPLYIGDWLPSTPAIGDINGDGRLDLVAHAGLWVTQLHAWDISSSRKIYDKVYGREWYMFQHDEKRSSRSIASSFSVVCGDTNSDGVRTGGDVTFLTRYVNRSGPAPVPLWAADVNGDTRIDQYDITYYVNYLKGRGLALRCPAVRDVLPPAIEITTPGNEVSVHGTVAVLTYAWDNSGVTGVRFAVDGVDIGFEDTSAPYSFDWDTTQLADGQHVLTAIARDAAGNSATTTATVTSDNTAPVVNITSPENGTWLRGGPIEFSADASDALGVTFVNFSIDGVSRYDDSSEPYGFTLPADSLTDGEHIVIATAHDGAENTSTMSITIYIDQVSPNVSITYPSHNQIITTAITVAANATDNSGVVAVNFSLGAINLGSDSEAPYTVQLNPDDYQSSYYNLVAIATDYAGNASAFAVGVHIRSGPEVAIVTPAIGYLGGTVTIEATATDENGVAGVQFLIDGANFGEEDTISPYSIEWDTTQFSDGTHTLMALARDTLGHIGSAVVIPHVDNTAPVVSFVGLQDGDEVYGSVTVNVNASDAQDDFLRVQFSIDGINIGSEDQQSPYKLIWDTSSYSEGNHTISATARDQVGNSTTATITVEVQNNPTVEFIYPLNGGTLSDYINLTASVIPSYDMSEIIYVLDGQDIAEGWSIGWNNLYIGWWDSRAVPNGQHTLTARIPGVSDAVAEEITVMTNNGNWLAAFGWPANGTFIWRTWYPMYFYLRSPSEDGVWGQDLPYDSVQYVAMVDDQPVNVGSEVYYPPYEQSWDISGVPVGWYTIRAMVDPAGEPAGDYVIGAEIQVQIVEYPW